jgi:hypothetical protein
MKRQLVSPCHCGGIGLRRAAVLVLVVSAVLLGVGVPALCHAQGHGGTAVVTPSDLATQVRQYDGQQVTLRGEVIGTVMRRGEYVWVNVGDGSTAVGVWVPARILEMTGPGGGYARTGDTVEVVGTFHAACPLHGGDPDLHAVAWRVVEKGCAREHCLPRWRWGLAAVLVGAGALLTLAAAGLVRRS